MSRIWWQVQRLGSVQGQWLQTSMTGSRFQVSAVPEGFEAGQEVG